MSTAMGGRLGNVESTLTAEIPRAALGYFPSRSDRFLRFWRIDRGFMRFPL